MKYRFTQIFLQLGMILINLVYSIILLIFWVFLFLGAFFWKIDTFRDIESSFFKRIPIIPTEDKDEKHNNMKNHDYIVNSEIEDIDKFVDKYKNK
jgi:hypothetical protein